MYRLSTTLLEQYTKDGFVLVKNIVPISRINTVLKTIFTMYCKYSGNKEDFKSFNEPWNTDLFHQKLIELRKNDPKSSGAIYDTLRNTLTLVQLVSDDVLVDVATQFLRKKPEEISISDHAIRIDIPGDVRNAHGWHQERSYFPQNRDGLHGMVCWIPLLDCNKENGTIHTCAGSHKEGLLNVTREQKLDTSYTTRIPVPEDYVKKYKSTIVEAKQGDAVFFNMLLFHRTGENISNKVRFTIQNRFHIATADDYIPFDYINHYSPFIKQKLLEKNYDCSDIPDHERQQKGVNASNYTKFNTN